MTNTRPVHQGCLYEHVLLVSNVQISENRVWLRKTISCTNRSSALCRMQEQQEMQVGHHLCCVLRSLQAHKQHINFILLFICFITVCTVNVRTITYVRILHRLPIIIDVQ